MMNILCIANDIGFSAAGVVFETIVKEMQRRCNVYIISSQVSDCVMNAPNITILPAVRMLNTPWRISNLSATLLGFNIADYIRAKQQLKSIDYSSLPTFDCVLSFVSQQKYFGLITGREISCKLKTKWVVYCVDAIPVPSLWDKNTIRRDRVGRVFRKMVSICDLLLFSNEQMLKYQLSLAPDFRGKSGVIYTPSQTAKVYINNKTTPPVFLYTGSMYGLRRMDILISAFRKFVAERPDARMIFVGNINTKVFDACQDLIVAKHIEVRGHVNNLSELYGSATVLLDVNAAVTNDVFLSSKIANYLPIAKPILCVSGKGSPARNIFVCDESIVHCDHDKEDIYNAMKKTVTMMSASPNRDKYILMFSPLRVVNTLVNSIIELSSN